MHSPTTILGPPPLQTFEYRFLHSYDTSQLISELNKLGSEGWRVIKKHGFNVGYLLERPTGWLKGYYFNEFTPENPLNTPADPKADKDSQTTYGLLHV